MIRYYRLDKEDLKIEPVERKEAINQIKNYYTLSTNEAMKILNVSSLQTCFAYYSRNRDSLVKIKNTRY